MATVRPPSVSALNVARCRAIAAHEPREDVRGPDTLAEIFLDEAGRQSLQNPAIHPVILQKLDAASPGGYEYFIARTAYLDAVVEDALRSHVPQLVFLGAGYDTRAYRFADLLGDTRVFELDEAPTQTHKRAMLEAAKVAIPPGLTYVPIDFTSESLGDKLTAAGYREDVETLFIWEGVTYYLPPRTVDETMAYVRRHSAPGSRIAFDYMLPEDQLEGRHGAEQSRAAMQAMYTDEPLHFDMYELQVFGYLATRGFELVEHMTAEDMQARYLTLKDGKPAGQILDLFRLVLAQVKPG
ncbi:MAG: SAM-dependent methyltransferase [Anaerolineae bacterium]|nr:SAM-dependent methyltransferase [Anaerolineae bacterium]